MPAKKPIFVTILVLGLAGFSLLYLARHRGPPGRVLGPNEISVRALGAVGDGRTKDTVAFQKAFDGAAARGAWVVDVPPGDYLIGSLSLPSHTTLNIEAGATLMGSDDASDYPLTTGRWEGVEGTVHQALISARDATGVAITGAGTIRGAAHVGKLRKPRGPTLLEFVSCRQIRVEGVTLENFKVWTLHPTYCQGIRISGVHFYTRGITSDGIDLDSSSRAAIDHCVFNCGDDDISLKSGRGLDGQRINRPTEDVTITNCRFERGIGAIALGSEVTGGIRRVAVRDCVFLKGLAVLYLKSNRARGGYVEEISAERLQTKIPLLNLESAYSYAPRPTDILGAAGLTTFRHLRFSDVQVESNEWFHCLLALCFPKFRPHDFVHVEGDPQRPVDGLAFADVRGYADHGFTITNTQSLELKNITMRCGATPLFSLDQVQQGEFGPAAPPLPPW